MSKIRVLVVDDHAVVREGICSLLTASGDMQVAGEAGDGDEAALRARELNPDVILIDLVMPRKEGIDAIREIRHQDPQARILVLTSFAEDRRVYGAIQAGALGYLLKDSSSDELLHAIRQVHRGQVSLQPSIALKVVQELHRPHDRPAEEEPLTAREAEVLDHIAQGLTNQEIARALSITEGTVVKHVTHILAKLHLASRTQAALHRRDLRGATGAAAPGQALSE